MSEGKINFSSFVFADQLEKLLSGELIDIELSEGKNPDVLGNLSQFNKIKIIEEEDQTREGFIAEKQINEGQIFASRIPLENQAYLYPVSTLIIQISAKDEIVKVKIKKIN
jgi:hypothetical protein